MTADQISTAQLRALVAKYTDRHQIVLPCPRDEEAAAACRSAADQLDAQAARIKALVGALQGIAVKAEKAAEGGEGPDAKALRSIMKLATEHLAEWEKP